MPLVRIDVVEGRRTREELRRLADTVQDVMLEVGTVTQTVEVRAGARMINLEQGDVSYTLNSKYYEDLPVVMGADMRLAETLLQAQPGYVPTMPTGDTIFRGSAFNSRINGGQTMAAENFIDGASFGTAYNHNQTQEGSPPYDAIAEMKRHIARLEGHPPPTNAPDLPSYRARGGKPPPPETDDSAGVDTTKVPR